MLEPSFAASKNPLTGVVPFHTAPDPRILAFVKTAAEGAGQTSRPTCGLELRLAHHCRSQRPAWLIRGCCAPGARHLEPEKVGGHDAEGAYCAAGAERAGSADLGSRRSPSQPLDFDCSFC
jgi:hypothetical protein